MMDAHKFSRLAIIAITLLMFSTAASSARRGGGHGHHGRGGGRSSNHSRSHSSSRRGHSRNYGSVRHSGSFRHGGNRHGRRRAAVGHVNGVPYRAQVPGCRRVVRNGHVRWIGDDDVCYRRVYHDGGYVYIEDNE